MDCEGDVHVRLWAAFISYTVSLPRHTSKSENEIQNETETETWNLESWKSLKLTVQNKIKAESEKLKGKLESESVN